MSNEVELTAEESRAAQAVFSDRLGLAERYVQHLATTGMERGLLGPREVPRLWSRHVLNCAVVANIIDLKLTLIEPLERRCIWLNEVVEDLGLENVTVLRGRAEQVVDQVNADFATARAVSALTNLAGLTIPLLHGKGTVLAIKGRSAAEEVEKATKVIRRLGGTRTDVVTVGEEILSEPTTVVRIHVG